MRHTPMTAGSAARIWSKAKTDWSKTDTVVQADTVLTFCDRNMRVPKRFYTIVARGQHGAYSLQVQRATLKNALRYAQILFPSRDGFWDWEAIECRCGNNEDLCEACEVYETYRGVKQ